MTGFRVISNPVKALKSLGNLRADTFAPEVRRFLGRALSTAIQLTPQRNGNTIRTAQKKQYRNRVNYIPSYHTLLDPSLIVKDDGTQWLFRDSKWYRPDIWNLPADVYADYRALDDERNRRMQTPEGDFVEKRMQARFLYRKTWWEIGQSAGVQVTCPQPIIGSFTRRNPAMNPPKGYAQQRGGKDAFSFVVRNPFLDQTSGGGQSPLATERYKPFTGSEIMEQAQEQHRPQFEKSVAAKAKKSILELLARLL